MRSTTAAGSRGQAYYVLLAADEEAARAGHAEVDVHHLLLGLLVTGGASARVLSAAGLQLGGAREAQVAVQQADLAALGVTATVPPVPRSRTYAAGTAGLRWSDRARRALADLPDGAPDTRLLTALLADGRGPARRLLDRAGVDAAAVLAAIGTVEADVDRVGPPEGGWTATHAQTVAVPRADVWAVVADPHRRPDWDDTVERVRRVHGRSFEALDAIARTLSRTGEPVEDPGLISTHVLTAVEEGRVLEWEVRYPARGHTEWLRVELADDGAGCRIGLRHRNGAVGSRLRPLAALGAWSMRARLRLLTQAVAQTAAAG
ncbi:Clp protease N-terminal domain-containing protein [Modestobacter sp. I12A-02662]|uniref:Clp protease N-terminal domain-containing protein n=1 Tax=Modestobacter sp. I12A-02662 TaxID=1730496 RepID=UPI0034DDFC65